MERQDLIEAQVLLLEAVMLYGRQEVEMQLLEIVEVLELSQDITEALEAPKIIAAMLQEVPDIAEVPALAGAIQLQEEVQEVAPQEVVATEVRLPEVEVAGPQ